MSFAVLVIASAADESAQDCRCRRKCQFAAGANFSLTPRRRSICLVGVVVKKLFYSMVGESGFVCSGSWCLPRIHFDWKVERRKKRRFIVFSL